MKKFGSLIVCLLIAITCCFAGCAGFKIDKVKYYNEVLATVGEEKITRYDLLSAYNSYGYSYYVSQAGQDEEDALSSTLDLLIDRESLYQYAKKNDELKPTKKQANEMIRSIFDSLDSQLETYLTQAKKYYNIKDDELSDDDSDDKTYLREDYTYSPRAEIVDGKLRYIEDTNTNFDAIINETYLAECDSKDTIAEIKSVYFDNYLDTLKEKYDVETSAKLYSKVRSLLVNNLMDYEYYLRDKNNKAHNKDSEDLLTRYFTRLMTSQVKSQYLSNLRTAYLKSESLSIAELTDKAKSMVKASYTTYHDNEDSYTSKMKDIGTKGDDVLYHPTNLADNTKFGYFIHTLIPFSETQKTEIKALDKIKDEETYNAEKERIVRQTKATARDENGAMGTDEISLQTVIDEYNRISALPNTTQEEYNNKLSKFIDFMFKYSTDTATLSAGMPYVVGTNGFSAMETAFTDSCVNLLNSMRGTMAEADLSNSETLCVTSYGIHLIFYVGEVNAFDIQYDDIDSVFISETDTSNPLNLYEKVLNPLTGETYFDMLFDKVYPSSSSDDTYSSNNGYSTYEKNIVNEYSSNVTKYTTRIKATKTSL